MTVDLARTGRTMTYIGAAAQLIGLIWDAALHRLDPDLAAREGVFTLTNPGHALFAGGLMVLVLGLGLMLLAGGRRARPLRYAGVVALAALSLGAVALAATGEGGLTGHTHPEAAGTAHTHEEPAASPNGQGGGGAAHDHAAGGFGASGSASQSRHQHQPDIPISLSDLALLNEQIAAARAGTEQYQDVRVALRDGYFQVTQDLPLLAAHFVNPRYVLDGVFDPAKPEVLLYTKQDGAWKLVGVSYLQPYTGSEQPPEGFAGPLDAWHYHTNLCFRGQRVISAQMSADQCAQAGGRFTQNTGWMVHLWLYEESPEGLFAHQNSRLKGSGAVLTRAELAAMQ